MKEVQLVKALEMLSHGQGFYSRLYDELMYIKLHHNEIYRSIIREWEEQEFTDILDFVLYLEG